MANAADNAAHDAKELAACDLGDQSAADDAEDKCDALSDIFWESQFASTAAYNCYFEAASEADNLAGHDWIVFQIERSREAPWCDGFNPAHQQHAEIESAFQGAFKAATAEAEALSARIWTTAEMDGEEDNPYHILRDLMEAAAVERKRYRQDEPRRDPIAMATLRGRHHALVFYERAWEPIISKNEVFAPLVHARIQSNFAPLRSIILGRGVSQ